MAKENKVEYERVDEKGDRYKRILVKFNPHFLRGSDFEIEFVPLEKASNVGVTYIKDIDLMPSIDLYQWFARQECLLPGGEADKLGTMLNKKDNFRRAKMLADGWRQGRVYLEPRQIINNIKRVFEGIAEELNEPLAYVYNYFLFSGELGSLPFANKDFNVEKLRYTIEEVDYLGFTAEGKEIKRALVPHLFDTHKTEYMGPNIWCFLKATQIMGRRIITEHEEK